MRHQEGDVTDIVLHDIEPVLADRIRRISEKRGWSMHDTLLRLLERGLQASEGRGVPPLDDDEAGALERAIAALEQVPDDSGFALIGRATPPIVVPEQPEQRIAPEFDLK